jgi:hypothetical protein
VALSSDGNTLIVGGSRDDAGKGAAWVFVRSGSIWTQQGGKLIGSGAEGNAAQGQSVSVSDDGNTMAVGGSGNGIPLVIGAVWIWTRSGSTWTQQGSKLVATGTSGESEVGFSVYLSSDGNTLSAGGPQDVNSTVTGATWVWTRSGTVWTQQTKIVGIGSEGPLTEQGTAVALSSAGDIMPTGARADNNDIGAFWMFTLINGTWTQFGNKTVPTGFTGTPEFGPYLEMEVR